MVELRYVAELGLMEVEEEWVKVESVDSVDGVESEKEVGW